MADINQEDFLRLSKSGYSLKIGWAEKRIVAKAPFDSTNDIIEQWFDDAERLCEGWNELPIAKNKIAKLESDKARLVDALRNARDDVASVCDDCNQLLPHKKHRYEYQKNLLDAIDSLLIEME